MTNSFGVTYDYRCPFARIANDHIVTALRAGADWDVDFIPFSLSQIHTEEGEPPVWEDRAKASDLLALRASLIVTDSFPEKFLDAHEALFNARHDESKDLRSRQVIVEVLNRVGIDGEGVGALLDEGAMLEELRKRHESVVDSHQVWGVPTFISGEHAAFARLMKRPEGDAEAARATIERIIDLVSTHPEVNELKHTTVPF
ncbi:MAG: DsbA family protein [Acidimicrobiales bacterium]|jgi:DSBA-like thioredoxin domain